MTQKVPATQTAEGLTATGQAAAIAAAIAPLATTSAMTAAIAAAVAPATTTAGTAVATTSGTSIDFTGIPSWAKRITILFDEVSTSGTSNLQIQIGTSGGFETTSYRSSSNIVSNTTTGVGGSATTGFYIAGVAATALRSGVFTLANISGNKWVHGHQFASTDVNYSGAGGGVKTLAGVLDRVRITTVNGTDTFDAGSINILYD